MDVFYPQYRRKIKSVRVPGQMAEYTVGQGKITAIQVDHANGQGAKVPWFAVYCGEEVHCHLNAAHVLQVTYFTEEPPD